MSWCAVDVASPPEQRDAVAAWLVGQTGQAVQERDDGVLITVAADEVEAGALLQALCSAFGGNVAGSTRAIPEVDWRLRWRDGLGPRRIGRLTIAPSWAATSAQPPCLIIDPESAFGSGEHGSTRSALLLLDRQLHPGDRVLDLGSGSGILAIAAAKLGALRATGVDLDPEVEPVARTNAWRNKVSDWVEFLTGDAAILAELLGPVELLLSNILRSQNEALLPAARAALAAGGSAIFAGMELTEREQFLAALTRAGFRSCDEATDAGWWGVTARVA
jgi:ribosomal protein L11 methyltransferase